MYYILDFFDSLLNSGIVGFLILITIIVWMILLFALPFFVSGINDKLKESNQLLAKIEGHLSGDYEEEAEAEGISSIS